MTDKTSMWDFQKQVGRWCRDLFGSNIAKDVRIRNFRFLEEALELVQSLGCTKDEAFQLVDYVYNRPLGEPGQEVGGAMVTLAALCAASDIDMEDAAWTEQRRCEQPEVMAKIRAKQASKIGTSALPGFGDPQPYAECRRSGGCVCGGDTPQVRAGCSWWRGD